MRTNEILYISNFKFSKNIKLIFLKIPIFLYLYLHATTLYYLDKILPPTIRTKINATLLTIPFSFFFRLHPHSKKKKKERNVLFHFSSVTRFTPVPRSKSQYFFEGGGKSDDIPKGRIFARRELLSTRYYASRRYNPLEAYAGQACPRPSFARSFTVVHVFMHFHPTTASWLDSTHAHTHMIVHQTPLWSRRFTCIAPRWCIVKDGRARGGSGPSHTRIAFKLTILLMCQYFSFLFFF